MTDKTATVLWVTAEVVVGVAFTGLLINVTSDQLHTPLTEPWAAWPALVLVLAVVVALAVRRIRQPAAAIIAVTWRDPGTAAATR